MLWFNSSHILRFHCREEVWVVVIIMRPFSELNLKLSLGKCPPKCIFHLRCRLVLIFEFTNVTRCMLCDMVQDRKYWIVEGNMLSKDLKHFIVIMLTKYTFTSRHCFCCFYIVLSVSVSVAFLKDKTCFLWITFHRCLEE